MKSCMQMGPSEQGEHDLDHGREYRTVLGRGEGETKIVSGGARRGGYFSLLFRKTSCCSSKRRDVLAAGRVRGG